MTHYTFIITKLQKKIRNNYFKQSGQFTILIKVKKEHHYNYLLKGAQIQCIAGTQQAQKSYESAKIKTSEMIRDNVLAGTEQFKIYPMLLNLI